MKLPMKSGNETPLSEVMDLQLKLNAVIPTVLEVDGIYGEMTETAVKVFQHRWHLDPTGEVDVQTWVQLTTTPAFDPHQFRS